jgi:hypothetical protein
LEIADVRVEFPPHGHAGSIGVSKLGEVGPIVLHGAGELQLLGVELLRAPDPVGSTNQSCARVLIGTNAKNVGEGIPTLT